MANRTIVTFGTDGFRDWVALPDGRSFNLGSVSVLNFVVGLARGQREARKALDTFLTNKEATLAVRMADLQILLAPKKARWAGLEETLIPSGSRTGSDQGGLMDQIKKTLFQSRLACVEDALHRLESGSSVAADTAPAVLDNVRELLAMVTPVAEAPVNEIPAPTVVSVGGVPGHVHTGNCRCRKTAASYDEDMLRELEVYLDNEMSLQAQRRTVLKKILKDGKYDVKEASKAFEDWVEAGAKSYAREFDEDVKKFPKDLIKDLADKMALTHKKAVEDGAYDHLKSADDEQQDPEAQAKEAASEVKPADDTALINEGIAHAVLAKIEKAHEAVLASTSKFASIANEDLSKLSSSLAALIDASDLADTTVRPVLLDLSKKADHVINHFVR